ncbi:MAG: SgcJ/EcaC family oxidoreductase [Verrucomicrobia bacterium]|nr:SgcJ/EcaC family oxidoreductase [Verrucomicrobiota bacterium]
MKRIVALITTSIAVSLVGPSCQHQTADSAATSPRDRASDEAAIRELNADMERAGNARDQARVAAAYTADGDIWMVAAFGQPDRRVVGPENIRRHLESDHGMPGEKLRLTVDKIRFLASDVALVEGTSTSTHDAGINRATATLVVVRQADGWKLAAARVMKLEKLP